MSMKHDKRRVVWFQRTEGSGFLMSATFQPKINLQTIFMSILKPRKPLGSRWSGNAGFCGTEYFILEMFYAMCIQGF